MDDREAARVIGEVTISYTVRELLSRMEERLIRMETRAENYATEESVKELVNQNRETLEVLGQRLDKLESVRDKAMGFAFAVGALSGGAAGWLANLITKGVA